jgi:hypothetical protein
MKRKILQIIIGLALSGCTESVNKLSGENLYTFTGNEDFFPQEVQGIESFPADEYSDLLKQLDEKSLADKYRGYEIVRLTVRRSFQTHFTILIERTEDGVNLTEKETYGDARTVNNGDTTKITYDIIELDSVSGKYFEVRKFMPMGDGPIEVEIERKIVDPLLKNKATKLETVAWNSLTELLNQASFWKMFPVDSTRGFDGSHYILETHSENGYYVVDRWSPKAGDFKKITDYIIGLSSIRDLRN